MDRTTDSAKGVTLAPAGSTPDLAEQDPASVGYAAIATRDGTPTFWSRRWSEHYHSREGALSEGQAKFVGPSGLGKRLRVGDVALLDVCFGLGYNALAACAEAERVGCGRLRIDALELDREVVVAAAEALRSTPLPVGGWPERLTELADRGVCCGDHFEIAIHWGDARQTVQPLPGPFDLVFHDPFSSQRCAELWTVDFFSLLRTRMGLSGELYTYSEGLAVRSSMLAAGLCVGQTIPVDGHRGGTVATALHRSLQNPLPVVPFEDACAETRGEPYRDSDLSWSNSEILADRERRMRARFRA